jgi:hypothetical protein
MSIISGTRTVAPSSGGLTTASSITMKDGNIVLQYGSLSILDNNGNTLTNIKNTSQNVGNIKNTVGADPINIDQTLYSTTDQRKLASAYFPGGVGIEKDLAVGGFIYGRIAAANSATTSTFIHVITTNSNSTFYPMFTDANGLQAVGALIYGDNTSTFSSGGLTYNPFYGKVSTDRVSVFATDTAISTTSGALQVVGGVGIGQDIVVGGNINPATSGTNFIGNSTETWAIAYLDDIYSKFVGNTFGNLILSPNSGVDFPQNGNGGVVDIFGDIRARGNNPVGTAPVVTNVLYVTMDGDDTNDGRAMDASRACRTVSGAAKSPYFQPGTQIRVAPGHYLENNPIRLKPYTSVVGSDIRTTGIEAINKTQDLFHVDSGCYIAFCQFLNGRSGLLPGNNYINGTNRGAYCTAFPPLTGDDRIDLFHSPYIQNCTNVSGPWLQDGTMFVPDETVQIPIGVGTGTWRANTTSIVVNVQNLPVNGFINAGVQGSSTTYYTGVLQSSISYKGTVTSAISLLSKFKPTLYDAYTATDTGATWVYTNARSLELGMSVSAGQQNPAFFNARTLMLANKPFLQAQVVSFLNETYNSGNTFTYNTSSCYRDTGLIVDAIGMDMLFDSNSDSTFSGLQYWSQGQYTGAIPSEITATISAIVFIKNQIIGLGISSTSSNVVTGLITTITNILSAGVSPDVTNLVSYSTSSIVNSHLSDDVQLIQTAKATIQQNVVNYVIANNPPPFTFNSATCYRDAGYIIDSISFDLQYGGNVQSVKSGVYYYGYKSTATNQYFAGQINETIAAYSYIQTLVGYIVTETALPNPYQTSLTQVILGTPATLQEANILQNSIYQITEIIATGPAAAEAKTPQNIYENTSTNIINAWSLLHANRTFIQAEVLAYVNATMTRGSFDFQPQKSYRDVGILVENVAYDVAFGGNEKSVESGLAYWNGPVSYIAGSISQCTAAINYLNDLIQTVITNQKCTVLPPVSNGLGSLIPQASQVINTALTGGSISALTIENCFNIITNIITQGPAVAPIVYKGYGLDASYTSAEILLQANRKFIQEQTINYINYNLVGPQRQSYLPYNKVKCARDLGILIDSIASDLLYTSSTYSQSTFAGLQYYNQSSSNISTEITTTTAAIKYLGKIAAKVIRNTTATDDLIVGVTRYTTGTQITDIQPGTPTEVSVIKNEFSIITTILGGVTSGWTDLVVANGPASNLIEVKNAYALLQANKTYMQNEVLGYITSPIGLNFKSFTTETCIRDLGYIIDSVSFDLLHGGNRQAIQSGLSYYNQNASSSVIPNETAATVYALAALNSSINKLLTGQTTASLQKVIKPISTSTLPATIPSAITGAIGVISNILTSGPAGYAYSPIPLTASTSTATVISYNIITSNRDFLIAEVLQSIDNQYNNGTFTYDQVKCYRDTGLLVDAVSQDILLGGNQKSIEAGLAYWNAGYNYVAGQETTTTAAIQYISSIAKQIIANTTVTSITGTVSTQIINPFFKYGDNYMAQQAVTRNFGIITSIISNGPIAAPPVYAGSGIFALTGVNGLDVKVAPTITYIGTTTNTGTYIIGLSTATIGFGINSSIYFGDTLVFPLQTDQVDVLSLRQTGNPNTWDSRKVDPIGAMGGSLVDGAVISDRSPIQSFVYDAFTQLSQGGRGIRITNNGYAQLVSVFTIFSSVGVQVDNGGIASIVNSNANFGDLCLVAKGYGKRSFSGTVYNPTNRAYPFSPGINGLDQYYPSGFWPDKNGNIEVFVPDSANRPHISLVMELVAPAGYQNAFNSPQLANEGLVLYGFLNAQPSTGTLVAGTVTLVDIPTTNVYVGNSVYILDQFGYPYDNFKYIHDEFGNYLTSSGTVATSSSQYIVNSKYGIWYAATGTAVSDVNFNSITLNQPLPGGADFPNNQNYFTLYFCGNSYYTVQTSQIANSPYVPSSNILSVNTNTNYQGPTVDQIAAHAAAMNYLSSLTVKVVTNQPITPSIGNYSKQYINTSLSGGNGTTSTIKLEFGYLVNIVTATNLNSALSVVPSADIVKSGNVATGAGSAISLIENNLDFLTNEVVAYVNNNFASVFTDGKCYRDTGLIVDAIAEDILYYGVASGSGNFSDMTFSGLQYWSQQYDTGFATANLVAQSTATVAAIQYLTSTVTNYISSGNRQTVDKLFRIINNILTNGPLDVTGTVIYGGPLTASVSLLADAIALQNNKSAIQTSVVNFVYTNYQSVFGTINGSTATRCSTDVGLIIDAVTFDMLTGGNAQSTKAGVYYFDNSASYSVIPNESTATIASFNFLATITNSLIQGTVGTNYTPLQTVVAPVTGDTLPSSPATVVGLVNAGVSVLTNIIKNGPNTTVNRFNLRPQNISTSTVVGDNALSWQIIHNNRAFIQAEVIAYINAHYSNVYNPNAMTDNQSSKCSRDVGLTLQQLMYDLETGGNYNMIYAGLSYWSRPNTYHIVELGEAVKDPTLFPDGTIVNFYQRSYISASGYVFEYVGAGTNYGALPQTGQSDPVQGRETIQLNSGKVFFTSTDQNGDFRIGPGLVISQATGVISGRTFTQSLFSNMTPFILAIT